MGAAGLAPLYLMIIKTNQPSLLQAVAAALAGPDTEFADLSWAENRQHYVRDVTFREDQQQVRTGNQPNAMAGIRNLVTGAFRPAGYANIAHARRCYGTRRPPHPRLYGYLDGNVLEDQQVDGQGAQVRADGYCRVRHS
jgi:hypothetical protein